jgi:aminopeptidase Y
MGYGRLAVAGGLILALLDGASSLEIPWLVPSQQRPLTSAQSIGKPLVSSEDLQLTINPKNLLYRAEELYKIAKLGEDEYNHPTRVIGSQGSR